MGAKYIFRLDDVCENMNWDNFQRVKDIFLKNDIKPIIGVIPENGDGQLLKHPKCGFDFWAKIYHWQNDMGWSVALHGHTHVYESEDSGVLKVNRMSEFAGLPKEVQCQKIAKGIEVFKMHEIRIDAFMAPAHSFDIATIECLKENGISVITDGYSLFPFFKKGILFVPQLFAKPRRMPFGIHTWCLHTNSMSKRAIAKLERFVVENREDIIPFSEAKNYTIGRWNSEIQGFILGNALIFARNLRKKKKIS